MEKRRKRRDEMEPGMGITYLNYTHAVDKGREGEDE
jgi:hypothetical protein